MKKHTTAHTTSGANFITVCSGGRSWCNGKRRRPLPVLSLSKGCLQAAGFTTGLVLDIVCEPGRLTITVAKAQTYSAIQQRVKNESLQLA